MQTIGRLSRALVVLSLLAGTAPAEDYPSTNGTGVLTIRLSYPVTVSASETTPPWTRGYLKLKPGSGDSANGGYIRVQFTPTAPPGANVSDAIVNYPVRVEYDNNFWNNIPKSVRDKIYVQIRTTTQTATDGRLLAQPAVFPLTSPLGMNELGTLMPFYLYPWTRTTWVSQTANLHVEVFLDPSVHDSAWMPPNARVVYDNPTLQTLKRPSSMLAPFVMPYAILYKPPGNLSYSEMQTSFATTSSIALFEGSATATSVQETWGIGAFRLGDTGTQTITRGSEDGIGQQVAIRGAMTARVTSALGPGAGDMMLVIMRPTFEIYRTSIDADAVIKGNDLLASKLRATDMASLINPVPQSLASALTAAERADLLALNPLALNPRAVLPPSRYVSIGKYPWPAASGGVIEYSISVEQLRTRERETSQATSNSNTTTTTSNDPFVRMGSVAAAAGALPISIPNVWTSRTETTTTSISSRTVTNRSWSDQQLVKFGLGDSDRTRSLCADVYFDRMFGTFAFQDCTEPELTPMLSQADAQYRVKSLPLTSVVALKNVRTGRYLIATPLVGATTGGGVAVVTPQNRALPPIYVWVAKGVGNLIIPELPAGSYHVAFGGQYRTLNVAADGQTALNLASALAAIAVPATVAPAAPAVSAARLRQLANVLTAPVVTNASSRKCLDVVGVNTADGANVQQYACNRGPNQRWLLKPLGKGEFQLVVEHSGKCLDVAGGGTADGANVQQFGCHSGGNQRWRLTPVAADVYQIAAAHSGKCLDVAGGSTADGANVQQFACHGGPNQRWEIFGVSELVMPLAQRF